MCASCLASAVVSVLIQGVNLVWESVGGEMFETCVRALANNGRLVVIGKCLLYVRLIPKKSRNKRQPLGTSWNLGNETVLWCCSQPVPQYPQSVCTSPVRSIDAAHPKPCLQG